MSDINTTITIKKFIKEELETCKDFSYEHWDDVMLRLAKFYKRFYKKIDRIIKKKRN